MASIKHDIFGPHVNATVTIVAGAADSIEIHHPNGKSSIKIPGDWAGGITGTKQEIIDEVSRNLNGAKVTAIP